MEPALLGFLMLLSFNVTAVEAAISVGEPSVRVMVIILLATSRVTEVLPSKLSLTRVVVPPLLIVKVLGRVTTILPLTGMGLTVVKETSTFPSALLFKDSGCTLVEVNVAGFTVCGWVALVVESQEVV